LWRNTTEKVILWIEKIKLSRPELNNTDTLAAYIQSITAKINFNVSRSLWPNFRKYMKKKLKLDLKSKVDNQDLADFFEYYTVNYMASSPLVLDWVKC
jgi:adenine specific DNA methylase Mod